jgi:hypothetical protein
MIRIGADVDHVTDRVPRDFSDGGDDSGDSSHPRNWRHKVLVLYRERSGEESYGNSGVVSAGAFSIQRLEGSRFGTVVLWVLKVVRVEKAGEPRNR